MLEDLRIKNFALIDNASVEFKNGFTVLSGETGAGKSLLIGALTFLLGGKGGVEHIRTGCQTAQVSGTFYLKGLSAPVDSSKINEDDIKTPAQWLYVHGIESEDDRILIRRAVRDTGKSAAWIGDTPVTRADLASFCNFLIDIHGQHEHQSLMRVSEHRKFLDSFAGLDEKVEEFTALYSNLVAKRRSLDELLSDDKTRAQKIDVLTFSIKEIEDAKLKKGEDRELEDEEKRLSSFEKLYEDIDSICQALEGAESSSGAVLLLKKIRSVTQHACQLDKNLESLDNRLESAFYELSDIAGEYSSYKNSLVFDPERLAFVQDRLTLIYNLKKKYASSVNASVEEVIQFGLDAQKRLAELSGGEKNKDSLKEEITGLEKNVYKQAKEISDSRKIAAQKMSEQVMAILKTLGMKDTRFAVQVAEKNGSQIEQKCGPYGMDDIEFLIAANPGNPLQSLAKIASGGELSRVMLALKTVLAETDSVETLVFDEIDTGIGGEVAVSVGQHLKSLAKKCQILCITHLASIAVYADNQLKIAKSVSEGMTNTEVAPIEGEQRVAEIARMLSGDAASQESLEHAKAMLAKFSSTGES
ncbi:DNA repair protein RecN [Treponema berlinense]|uniref:DNA repair protein RecN n=1 Tax=Treponema berlinense TaxID=225004 RepID=UPI003FD7F730